MPSAGQLRAWIWSPIIQISILPLPLTISVTLDVRFLLGKMGDNASSCLAS